MSKHLNENVQKTIDKTLATARLFEGFWDRWAAHGVERKAVIRLRSQAADLQAWLDALLTCARTAECEALDSIDRGFSQSAERAYRIAGLYYNLAQWIFPVPDCQKREWYERCEDMTGQADAVAKDEIKSIHVNIDGKECFGRLRIPVRPKGCVVMINPIDSSKEELFTYEADFASAGFAVASFDGPGQGETLMRSGFRASRRRWTGFVGEVIDSVASYFPALRINLFGTSSGAAWAIHGSLHHKVSKVVAVSPALEDGSKMPDYFMDRLSHMLESNEGTAFLPELDPARYGKPIYLFHGNKDVMVRDAAMHKLYERLPEGRRMKEYEDEGHCCNFKLEEIRKLAAEWYLEDK